MLLGADITIGVHEIAGAIGLLGAITAFLIALWMREIKSDVHDLVARVNEHTGQIARLEARSDSSEVRLDKLEGR